MIVRLICRLWGHRLRAHEVIPGRPWRGEADRIVVLCDRGCGATAVVRAIEGRID